mmetsp:Transcript_24356/g.59641  ORF Transcript_24356/g.59641 Transcript_24356/m.59641 type:complete len:239 (-) Transcript_24356:228-944(-)
MVDNQILEARKLAIGGTQVDSFPRLFVAMIFQKSSCITNTLITLPLVISLIRKPTRHFRKWFINGGQTMGGTTIKANKSLESRPLTPCLKNVQLASMPFPVLTILAALYWISNLKRGMPPITIAPRPLRASPAFPSARIQQRHHLRNVQLASRPFPALTILAALSWISNLKLGVPPMTNAPRPLRASPAFPSARLQQQRHQQLRRWHPRHQLRHPLHRPPLLLLRRRLQQIAVQRQCR